MIIFVTACAPISSDVTQTQTTDSAEASATTTVAEEDHSDEDSAEHESEEGEHSDEATEEEGHEEGDEHRELGAHEHGVAELTIAWSGGEMAIDLHTPAFNVLGFEHAPASDEEEGFLTESVAALEAGNLLLPNAEAECTLVSANVQAELAEEGHEEEAQEEETHSDIDVSYNLACVQPDKIASLDASALFAQFPNFEGIQVQWISDTQQSAATLTPDNPVISFN
jgi:hypothetical protein